MSEHLPMTPLFVMGAHRSGTTWLANLLCGHSQICGIQSQEHWGIVESWYYSHLDGRFGDLSDRQNFENFTAAFFGTEFFRASQVSRESAAKLFPTSYARFLPDFFKHARQNGERFWLEKTPVHTLYIQRLLNYYPEARFIGVQRPILPVVRSAVQLQINKGRADYIRPSWKQLGRIVIHWNKYRKYLNHFVKAYPEHFICVQYEHLLNDRPAQLERILTFLGLDWEDSILETRYPQNTSFENSPRAHYQLDRQTQIGLRLGSQLLQLLPYRTYWLHEQIRAGRNSEEIPWCTYEEPRH